MWEKLQTMVLRYGIKQLNNLHVSLHLIFFIKVDIEREKNIISQRYSHYQYSHVNYN